MFTHLGAGNIGAVIRRHRLLIAFCLILSVFTGYAFGMTRAWSKTNADHKDVYQKTVVLSIAQAMDRENADEQVSFYLNMMRTQDCQTYVANQIRDNHVSLWLNEAIDLKHMTSKFPVFTDKMKFTTAIRQTGESPAITLTTQSYYQKLSQDLLQYYLNYVNTQVQDKELGLAPLVLISQQETVISPTYDDQTHVVDRFGRYNIDAVSFTRVIAGTIGLITGSTCLLILLFCALSAHFHPTVNRRKDLEQEGIPVISEIGRLGRIRRG